MFISCCFRKTSTRSRKSFTLLSSLSNLLGSGSSIIAAEPQPNQAEFRQQLTAVVKTFERPKIVKRLIASIEGFTRSYQLLSPMTVAIPSQSRG
jgi:hypothetical protein